MEQKKPELDNQIEFLRRWAKIFGRLMNDHRPNLPVNAAATEANDRRRAYSSAYQKMCELKAQVEALRQQATAATTTLDSPSYKQAHEALEQAERAAEKAGDTYQEAVLKCERNDLGLTRKRILSDDQIRRFTGEMYFYKDQEDIKGSLN
jgi:hypothetical protein